MRGVDFLAAGMRYASRDDAERGHDVEHSMIELRDIPFTLDSEVLMRQQRIQPGTDSARLFTELVDEVREAGRPKALYDVCYIEQKGDETVTLNGIRFTSRVLRRNLDTVERVFPYVATCGTEADAITAPSGDLRRQVWLWTLKQELLHAAVDHLTAQLTRQYQLAGSATMNPGSGDADVWPLAEQDPLFRLFGGADSVEAQVGVRLQESLLMVPTMSVSGILFPAAADFHSCQVCHREGCPSRKAPFDEDVWQAVCAD